MLPRKVGVSIEMIAVKAAVNMKEALGFREEGFEEEELSISPSPVPDGNSC